MQVIIDNYREINRAIDNTINSMKIVLPNCITKEDLKAQAFYKICIRISKFDSEKGSISQFCYLVTKHTIINFLLKVGNYKYSKIRDIVSSDDPNICKAKEINYDYLFDMQDESDMFDLIAVDDLFNRTIAQLKPRERFLAVKIYREGWETRDIMEHYNCNYIKAKNLRNYMQLKFRQKMTLK